MPHAAFSPVQDAPTRIGIYGGTFDPVHNGHLILARDAREQLKLDRILLVPAAKSPHKLHRESASPQARLRMLRAAADGEPGVKIEECELHRPGPSYAVDTVTEIGARYPGAKLFFLIGQDQLPALHTWRRIEELKTMVEFVVFGRSDVNIGSPHPFLTRRIDISSTEIRERIARGASIRYLVPEPVRAFIEYHQLYRECSPAA